MAEVLLKRILNEKGFSGIKVSSAGTYASWGSPASQGSRSVLKSPEDLEKHRARQVDEQMLSEADLVLAMTTEQKNFLTQRFPHWSEKIFSLSEYAWGRSADIADPFGGSRDDYLRTRAEIERALQRVAEILVHNKKGGKKMKLALASDHGGYRLKEELKDYVVNLGHQHQDFGCPSEEAVDYPDLAAVTARAVASGQSDLGIIVCGTGQGMAIAANKIKGVRAANCHDCFSAKMARAHNNANVLTLGQRVVGSELAKMIVEIFISTEFEGERHQMRLDKITALEEEFGR